MTIDAKDIVLLSDMLDKEFSSGNRWAIYEDLPVGTELSAIEFFSDRLDAAERASASQSDVENWKAVKILPLLRKLQKAQVYDRESFNIRLYEIDDDTFKLTRGYRKGTAPDWLGQTDHHGESLIRDSELFRVGMVHPVPVDYDNLKQLSGQLTVLGFKGDYGPVLENKMKRGRPFFGVRGYEKNDNEILSVQLAFVKTDAGDYDLAGYKATLYNYFDVDHATINGVDSKALEKAIIGADWNIDLIESEKEWIEAYRITWSIEDSLRLLSHNEDGARIAVQLWNNYVDPAVYDKPAFLKRIEVRMDIYSQVECAPDKPLQQAHEYLKKYNEVADQIRRLGISSFNDKQSRSDAIETLLDHRRYPITVPTTRVLSDTISEYNIVEYFHSELFKSGPVYERKEGATTFSEAMDVFVREIAIANNDPSRRLNDFTLVGRLPSNRSNTDNKVQEDDQTGYIIAVANNSWNAKNQNSPIETKVITNPLVSPILESLYISFDEETSVLKFQNQEGQEYKKDIGRQFRPVAPVMVVEHPTRIECVNTSDTEQAVKLYDQLVKYPIVELGNDAITYKLLNSIADGNSELVTLYRELRPSEHIEWFVILDYEYSTAGLGENHSKMTEVGASKSYDEAVDRYYDHLTTITIEAGGAGNKEVLLVGEYHGRKLEFNFIGTPEVNTGYVILTGYPTTFDGNRNGYEVVQSDDYQSPVTINETLIVKLDQHRGVIMFADILKGPKEIDKDFWSTPDVSQQQNVLLSSIQNESVSACNKKIDGDWDDVKDSLIPKLRAGSERGFKL